MVAVRVSTDGVKCYCTQFRVYKPYLSLMTALIFGTKSVLVRCLRIYAIRAKNQGTLRSSNQLGFGCLYRGGNPRIQTGFILLDRVHFVFRASKAFLVENTFLIGIYVLEDTSLTIKC